MLSSKVKENEKFSKPELKVCSLGFHLIFIGFLCGRIFIYKIKSWV